MLPLLLLLIGYFIWGFLVLNKGQTPGKQLLGIYAAKLNSPDTHLSFGQMFLREFVFKGLVIGFIISIVSGGLGVVVNYLFPLWDKDNQTLHDKMSETSILKN